MKNTIDQVIQYARDHPKRDGKSWAGWCESFVWRAGGFNGSFNSALLAGNASGPLNPSWAQAPRGAIHYWAGVGGDGHVAYELGGGTLLMASSRTSNYGTALGTIHFTDYGLPEYRGWSMRHGTETLAPSTTTAGSGANELEIDMATALEVLLAEFDSGQKNPDGTPRPVKLFEALQAIYFYGDRIHALATNIERISKVNWTLLNKPSTAIDPVKLAEALKAAGLTVTIDATAIAKAVDASLKDDFAKIPGDVRAAIVK